MTRQELAQRIAAALSQSDGAMRSPGERFRYSTEYRRMAERARGGAQFDETVEVLRQDELVRGLRQRATVDTSVFYTETDVQVAPLSFPATVLELIAVVPVEHGIVPLVQEQGRTIPTAGGAPFGVPAQEQGTSQYNVTRQNLQRWALDATLMRDVLEDSSLAEATINDLIETSFRRALEVDVLSGDGSTTSNSTRLTGILTAGGLGIVNTRDGAHASETNLDAIARAVNQVQDAGWYTNPIGVAAHPDSLFRTRTSKASTGGAYLDPAIAVPDVKAWAPATTVTAGQALVGDFRSGAALYVGGGVGLRMTNGFQDYLTRGLVRVQLLTHLWLWVRQSSAFCEVSAL